MGFRNDWTSFGKRKVPSERERLLREGKSAFGKERGALGKGDMIAERREGCFFERKTPAKGEMPSGRGTCSCGDVLGKGRCLREGGAFGKGKDSLVKDDAFMKRRPRCLPSLLGTLPLPTRVARCPVFDQNVWLYGIYFMSSKK